MGGKPSDRRVTCPTSRDSFSQRVRWARGGAEGRGGAAVAGFPLCLFAARLRHVQVAAGCSLPAGFDLEAVFARAYAFSLGKVTRGKGTGPICDGGRAQAGALGAFGAIGRSSGSTCGSGIAQPPGEHDFEPSITPAAVEAAEAIRRACPMAVGRGMQASPLSLWERARVRAPPPHPNPSPKGRGDKSERRRPPSSPPGGARWSWIACWSSPTSGGSGSTRSIRSLRDGRAG